MEQIEHKPRQFKLQEPLEQIESKLLQFKLQDPIEMQSKISDRYLDNYLFMKIPLYRVRHLLGTDYYLDPVFPRVQSGST